METIAKARRPTGDRCGCGICTCQKCEQPIIFIRGKYRCLCTEAGDGCECPGCDWCDDFRPPCGAWGERFSYDDMTLCTMCRDMRAEKRDGDHGKD